jgi:LPS export ABC transporter protein LptC
VFSAEAESALTVRLQEIAFQRLAGNRVEFEVRARQGTFEPVRRIAQLQDVRTFFRDEDRGVIRLQSETADFDLAKQTFIMTGAVEGTTASGERFSTSSARYDRERSRIVVDAPVALQSGRVESRGSGLIFDLASRELTLFDIRGRREAESGR